MEIFKIKISPEVLKGDLGSTNYSGQTIGFYSGLTDVLSAGTINLGRWLVTPPVGPGTIGSSFFQTIGPNTSSFWISGEDSNGKLWNNYFVNVIVGATIRLTDDDGRIYEFRTVQRTNETIDSLGNTLYAFIVTPINVPQVIPYGTFVNLTIIQPNTSELIDMSIPVLLKQDFEDIGYYSPFDGFISQCIEEVNFTFTAEPELPFRYCIYNTSNYNLNYFQNATYFVDWGDGTPIQQVEVFIPQSFCHIYEDIGEEQNYTISFSGTGSMGTYVVTKKVQVPYLEVTLTNFFGSVSYKPDETFKGLLQFENFGNIRTPIDNYCGADEITDALRNNQTTRESSFDLEEFTRNFILDNPLFDSNKTPTIVIPVVFHVVYNTPTQNISDSLILSQIDQLNLDFSASSPDVINTPEIFQPIGNMNIQFCLATQDPDGRPTNGIIRKPTLTSFFTMGNGIQFDSMGGSNAWPRDKYLNIWIGPLQGINGFAPLPPSPAAVDGIAIDYETVGSLENLGLNAAYGYGRVAVHEVGHWLNLQHIWKQGDGDCESDDVSDTPTHDGPNYGCPQYPHLSNCQGNPVEMTMNFMDYTNALCQWMFSPGQVLRSRALFEPGGPRHALLSSTGCEPPFLPPTATVEPTPFPTPDGGGGGGGVGGPLPTPTPTIEVPTPVDFGEPVTSIKDVVVRDNYNRNFDSAPTIEEQVSLSYIETPFIISGFTQSRLNELQVYGPNPYINGLIINLSDGTTGYVVSQTDEYIVYVINDQTYIDFANGNSIFIVQSSGLTDLTITATSITKFEYLMNVIEQPEIQSNVFIERGKISGLENFRRIGEVNNTGSLRTYGYGYFDIRNYNEL